MLNELTIGKGIIEQDGNIVGMAIDSIISKIIVKEGTTKIGNNALDELRITSLTLPEGIIHIGNDSLARNSFTSIQLPTTLQSIDIGAFYSTPLEYIVIPSNVTTINRGALGDNRFLKKIVNKTGRNFDWNFIVNEETGTAFVTGMTSNNILVTDIEDEQT